MRIFSAIILFFLTFAAVCSEKIALASYGKKAENAAELFLARFSGEYEFVERSSFAMLRNEQNLQQEYGLSLLSRRLKPVGADIFMAFEELPENQSSPDSCVKCYTMFLPFLLIKIDVFS